jgi:hypothetical protein
VLTFWSDPSKHLIRPQVDGGNCSVFKVNNMATELVKRR